MDGSGLPYQTLRTILSNYAEEEWHLFFSFQRSTKMALSSCSAINITHFVRVFDFWAANMSLTMWLQWSGDGDRVSMTNLLVAQIEYNYTFSGFFFQMDFRWKLNGPLKGSLTRTWSVGGIEFSFVTLDWNALVQDECNWNFENTYRLPLQIG